MRIKKSSLQASVIVSIFVLICISIVRNDVRPETNKKMGELQRGQSESISSLFNSLIGNQKKLAPLSFEVCEGLSNQRIAIIQGILIGYVSRRPVILPELYSSYIVSEGKKLAFGAVYNVSHLKDSLAGLINFWDYDTKWRGKTLNFPAKNEQLTALQWLSITNGTATVETAIKLSCTFNSIKVDRKLDSILWKIDRSVVLQNELGEKADKIKKTMPDGFTALHYRAEQDWIDHCVKWESIPDGVIRNNCASNTDAIASVFATERVSTDRPVYLAGGHPPSFIKTSALRNLEEKYSIVTKSSVIDMDKDFDGINSEVNLLSNREMFAAIDFAVCIEADLFIGNSVSTFSAMIELRRMQENRPSFHYNGGDIPLEGYLPVSIGRQPRKRKDHETKTPLTEFPKPFVTTFTISITTAPQLQFNNGDV